MRTDRRRLLPLERDTEQTTALRSAVRPAATWSLTRVAVANQVRSHLHIVFPAAATRFDVDSDISLLMLERFSSQARAEWLSVKRLAPAAR